MFVPFAGLSSTSDLERRKGGGGGGSSSGSSSSSSGKSSGSSGTSSSGSSGSSTNSGSGKSSSGSSSGTTSSSSTSKSGTSTGSGTSSGSSTSSSGKTRTVPLGTSTANGDSSAVAYGVGGGSAVIIATGQPFAGRSAGGGSRNQIYGTSTYGSGYPGITSPGVSGRGFPFWFWPVVWTGNSIPHGSYLQAPEYGQPDNTSRVGGPMAEATFISNSTNTTFHILSDNSTVSSLISSIDSNCSSSLSSSSSTSPQLYNASTTGIPQPEQAIQYYRASSIVLTLDGYNNSATFSNDTNATDSALPSGIDTTLLDCLNQTIALAAPLISASGRRMNPTVASLFGILWLVWWILLSI